MSEKSTISTGPDRDDPPRFTREMAERGRHMIGDQVIREARPRGRPLMAAGERKEKVTLRFSPEVLSYFRGQGEGWQTSIDRLLRHHVRQALSPEESSSFREERTPFLSKMGEPAAMRSLFIEALAVMEGAFQRLAAQVPPPRQESWANLGFVFRFAERSCQQALVLKLARQVSGLYAIDALILHGLVQEQGVIQRTLDEIGEDIFVLAMGLQDGMEALHNQLLEEFWAEEFDHPGNALKSTQKRGSPPRRKVHAYLARLGGGDRDRSTAQEVNRTISKAYSGYVHAAAPHIMDMYGGNPPRFHVSGMRGTSRLAEHIEDAKNYFYRGLLSVIIVARALGDEETNSAMATYVSRFEAACGTSIFSPSAASSTPAP